MNKPWIAQYPPGVPADIGPLRHSSLTALLEEALERFAERPAFTSFGTTLSYAEIDRASRHLAAYLATHCGMRPGERLAIMLPNIMQYPTALMAAFRAGLVAVNCNPLYTPRELHHQLMDSGATGIVILDHATATLREAIVGTNVRVIVVTRLGDMLPVARSGVLELALRFLKHMPPPVHIGGATPFKAALAQGAELAFETVAVGPEDLAFIQYTGGTTGVPKGAMLMHRNLLANLEQITAWVGAHLREGEETIVTPLPLYHVFALSVNLLTFLKLGARNVLIADPRDIPRYLRAIRDERFSVVTGVNTLYRAMVDHPAMAEVDTSALKMAVSGGMAQERKVAERWMALTGKPLIEGYGLTESSPLLTANRVDITDFTGTSGLPIPSTEMEARDESGAALPSGEVGELCARGPQVMKGYWNRPDETARVLDADGWLRTGDLGFVDERGYVKIADRKKDVIVVSGFKVFPNEVEEVAAAHPGVLEAAAVGVSDSRSGEAVKLVVVKRIQSVTADEIIEYCSSQLTAYKVPHIVQFRDTPLPKTAAGKPLRRALRAA